MINKKIIKTMKVQNFKIYLLSLVLIISQVYSLANTYEENVHEDAQYPKAFTLYNEKVIILSSIIGENKLLISQYDENGETVFSDMPLNIGSSGNGKVVSVKDYTILFAHNEQKLSGAKPYDTITKIKDGKLVSSKAVPNSRYYVQKSAVALKCGKVLLAGITGTSTDGALTNIDINLYEPKNDTFGNGISIEVKGKLVSCYEQKENQVYCAYVYQQYPFVAKLKLQLIAVNPNSNSVTSKGEQVIKTFYTEFNFLKAVPFNEEEAIIVFRVGNGNTLPRYGNSGKDLLYYHIKVSSDENLVTAIRYEKLNDGDKNDYCKYRKEDEDDSIDVGVLSKNRIYIACESNIGRFKGFIIYPGKEGIDEFNFNNFDAKEVRNPTFAKFNKTMGIFYTHINENDNYNVNFHLMNYPDCRDYYENKVYLIRKHYSKDDIDFYGKVFMNNAYPASRQNEIIYIRFYNISNNISIINTLDGKEIIEGKDYDPSKLIIKITPIGIDGFYSIGYKATRIDNLDGLILGKMCKISFETPKCLEQCYSCERGGTEEKHQCLGCVNVSYYMESYDGNLINVNPNSPHFCKRCNESCYDCHGPFLEKPITTTNCKRCDYQNGYYHLEGEERTCISYETKQYWKDVLGYPIYLDKNNTEDKTKWRWKPCHPNCEECSGPGTDEDNQCDICKNGLHFFCNQTKGNGIPGSCHADCVNNGFYLKESEGFQKCCPCLDNCKECKDEHTCDYCYNPFYLSPNNDSCVKDCDYCYAKDNTTFRAWQCVNCKTRYPEERFNLNGTCYKERPLIIHDDPYFEENNKTYHVIDETCNWLIGCKGGCKNCKYWYTEQCTQCFDGFYKKDYFGEEQPDSFPCYTERECHGLDKYQFNTTEEIGGVCKNLTEGGVCYNCKLREGNYRQVENNFTCGPKGKRTYANITEYNKLSNCYFRCASCDEFGNVCRHNCLTCREPNLYGLNKYDENKPEGDCRRYTHKCKDLPYVHIYDLAQELGIDEDSCGQDCDVCLENRTCPEQFPFYVIATRECVEMCGFNEIMSQTCSMNQSSAIGIFMNNPFDLPDKYNSLNQTIKIEEIIKKSLLEKYAASLNIEYSVLIQNINTYLGKENQFELLNNEIITGSNISFEITTNKIENEKMEKIIEEDKQQTITTTTTSKNTSITITANTTVTTTKGEKAISTTTTTPSVQETTTPKIIENNGESKEETILSPVINVEKPPILNITECENILKEVYNLPKDENLLIFKGSNVQEFSQYVGNNVNFLLFSTSLFKLLPLDACINANTKTLVTDVFNAGNLLGDSAFQKKINSVTTAGYNAFNIKSSFYTDICTAFTNENGNDVLIDDRIDYYVENLNICPDNCDFLYYNESLNTYTCACPTGITNSDGSKEKELVTNVLSQTYNKKHTNSNIKVFKCASQVFSSKGQKNNFGSYILLACLTSFIGVFVFYILKERKINDKIFEDCKKNDTNEIKPNPPKNDEKTGDSGADSKTRSRRVEENNVEKKDIYRLNNAKFDEAKEEDKRTFLEMYWSFLQLKQSFIFTFYTTLDRNIRSVKIALFILFISFYLAFTALFFNDSIMRKIYIYRGNTDAAVHIPNIILSSLCCIVMNFLVNFISLNDRNIYKAKNSKSNEEINKIKKIISIKIYILFGVSFALILLFWYYVSAFCAVFKNSQGHYFINTLVAFIVCNIWPFVTSLIPAALRKYAIKNQSSCPYTASKIVFYI